MTRGRKAALFSGSPHRGPWLAGLAAMILCIGVMALGPAGWRDTLKAAAEDRVLQLAAIGHAPGKPAFPVAVVEIDSTTLSTWGRWPWPRHQLAMIVNAIAERRPAAIGLDMLLAGPDPRSPLRELKARGFPPSDPLVTALAERVPDGDAALRAALARQPSVAGIALDPAVGRAPSAAPTPRALFLTSGPVRLDAIWRAGGIIAPEEAVPETAGLGVIALPVDHDGVVRRVALVAEAGGALYPGLALDVLRQAMQASTFIMMPDPERIMVGDVAVPLPADGLLRLVPRLAQTNPLVRVSAQALLAGDPIDLSGHLVLLGVVAPEAGGLRLTADDVLTPSLWLQARALQQMLMGISPVTPRQEGLVLIGLTLAFGVVLIALPLWLPPVTAALAGLAVLALAGAGAVLVAGQSGVILNPLPVLLAGPVAFITSALAAFAFTRRQAARIRQRFEQHLSPDVVALVAANLASPKLAGEKRMITALFTDIEDFTALTERAGPEILVSLLDSYFEGVVPIVLRYGGTVDKIVGDAVHAFFNAPIDIGDHAGKALACAEEILAWTERFRQGRLPSEQRFGRTRIGMESGEAIVGDVGFGAKLDYTAHGYAVNAAARLEAANKVFGSSICIGPGAAALLGAERLHPLGPIRLRGIAGEAQAYAPVPPPRTP